MRYTIIIPNTAGHVQHVNDGECGWRGEGAVIGLVIGLKHELCASVKVSADQLQYKMYAALSIYSAESTATKTNKDPQALKYVPNFLRNKDPIGTPAKIGTQNNDL